MSSFGEKSPLSLPDPQIVWEIGKLLVACRFLGSVKHFWSFFCFFSLKREFVLDFHTFLRDIFS